MSRVEDDRQADRVNEQLQIQKQLKEAKAKEQNAAESAFAKKMQNSQGETNVRQARQTDASAHDGLLEDSKAAEQAAEHTGMEGRENVGRQVLRHAAQAFQDKLKSRGGEGERLGEARLAAAQENASTEAGRAADHAEGEHVAEGRTSDSRSTRDELDRFGKGQSKGSGASAAQGKEGELKSDPDAGGGKGKGGDKKDGGGDLGAGFRFNPALMAPVPVARPKDTGASERLRKLAMEIAQKIVEHVRVGTNAKGAAEFQIDLRSNVLSGLQIKVSGGHGKISAVFSGSDREVLKLLEENADGLKQALAGRGISLEDFKIEAKA